MVKKEDLEKAVLILSQCTEILGGCNDVDSAKSVADALQKAIGEVDGIEDNTLCYLRVEKVPTREEIALEKSCSDDCIRFRKGDCPFLYEERVNCPRVRQIYESLS